MQIPLQYYVTHTMQETKSAHSKSSIQEMRGTLEMQHMTPTHELAPTVLEH